MSGGTTIIKMADLGIVRIRALFNESDIGNVHPGEPANVTVDAFPDRRFSGVVEKIEPQAVVQQNVTMFPVLVNLTNNEGLLKPGMNGEVSVLIDERDNVLAIPNDAIKNTREAVATGAMLGLSSDSVQAELKAQGFQRRRNRGGRRQWRRRWRRRWRAAAARTGGGRRRSWRRDGGAPAASRAGGRRLLAQQGRSGRSAGRRRLRRHAGLRRRLQEDRRRAQGASEGEEAARRSARQDDGASSGGLRRRIGNGGGGGGGGGGIGGSATAAAAPHGDGAQRRRTASSAAVAAARGGGDCDSAAVRGGGGGGGRGGSPEMQAINEQMRAIYTTLSLDPRTAGACARRQQGQRRPVRWCGRPARRRRPAARRPGGALTPSPEMGGRPARQRIRARLRRPTAPRRSSIRASCSSARATSTTPKSSSGLKEGDRVVMLGALALQAQRQQQQDRARAERQPAGRRSRAAGWPGRRRRPRGGGGGGGGRGG